MPKYQDLTFFQVRDDSTGVGTIIGSQTDLGSDSAIGENLPRRDKQELKAEYKKALKQESKLQTDITRLDEKITQAIADDNNSRPLLLQEKEVLLEEIRRLNSLVRSEGEKVSKRLLRYVFFSVKFLEKDEFTFFQKFRLGRNLTLQPPLGNAWSRDAWSFRKLLRVALWDSTDERTSDSDLSFVTFQ